MAARRTRTAITSRPFGTAPDGAAIECWTLERADLRVEVLTFGARLHAVHMPDRHGTIDNVVAGPAGMAGHISGTVPFAGAIVGRWANRLGGGAVEIEGVDHPLATNEGTTTLHGGPTGFDRRTWRAEPVSDGRGPAVRLHLISPDGDNGFPGTLEVTATYRLLHGGALGLEIEATTDAPTVCNLTTHAHWDLGGGNRVGSHRLRVPADRYVEVDEQLLPVAVRPVDGTPFDLRAGGLLDTVLDKVELDHCYLLDTDIAAELSHGRSGRRLVMTTDQPAAQVYLGGQLERRHAAIAIEPQVAPDAPNRPDLDLGPRGLLHPGETYRHHLTMQFDVA